MTAQEKGGAGTRTTEKVAGGLQEYTQEDRDDAGGSTERSKDSRESPSSLKPQHEAQTRATLYRGGQETAIAEQPWRSYVFSEHGQGRHLEHFQEWNNEADKPTTVIDGNAVECRLRRKVPTHPQ